MSFTTLRNIALLFTVSLFAAGPQDAPEGAVRNASGASAQRDVPGRAPRTTTSEP